MNRPQRGIWRPLRWFLLIASASAVLAADNTWMTRLRFDFKDSLAWLSNYYPAQDRATADMPLITASQSITAPGAELSMGRLLNGLLFSRPSTSWRLDSSSRTELASAWMEQQQRGSVTIQAGADFLPTANFGSGFAFSPEGLTGPMPSAPTAADGNWISNASGNWGTAANWQGGIVADGVGHMARFDLLDITQDVTVTLDTSRTIGFVSIGDTNGTNHYTIAPSGSTSLTFDSGDTTPAHLNQSSTSAGDTISSNIFLKGDLNIFNASANPLTISGNVSSSATSSFQTLGLAGNVTVSGNITNGNTGSTVFVLVASGTVTLTGTNAYTGGTEVDGGTLLVNGNNSAATGGVFVYDTGTLGGHGTMGGSVFTFGGTITGDTATTVGTLTLTGNVNLSTGEGAGGTYLANLSGSMSDLLAITGNLNLGAGTTLNIVGSADGTTTYILATFANHQNVFDMVSGIPGGYALVYNPTDLELVPIPEPATWLGGALALVFVGIATKKKLRR
jgi:autotransporter-associated beta strand protein